MSKTPREEREEREKEIKSLWDLANQRAESLASKGLFAPEAYRFAVNDEIARIFEEINRLQSEVRELQRVEDSDHQKSGSSPSTLLVGAAIAGLLLVIAVTSGSWLAAIATILATGWTAASWARRSQAEREGAKTWPS